MKTLLRTPGLVALLSLTALTTTPCPPGMTPGASSFLPAGGFAKLCGPANG